METGNRGSVRLSMANLAVMVASGVLSVGHYGRYRKRNFDLVDQTPQQKEQALKKAQLKRDLKALRRCRDNNQCLYCNPLREHTPPYHWQISK